MHQQNVVYLGHKVCTFCRFWLRKLKKSTKKRKPPGKGASRGFRPPREQYEEDFATEDKTISKEEDTQSQSGGRKRRYILFVGLELLTCGRWPKILKILYFL